MTTLLLLITGSIPNPGFEKTNNYLSRILFHVDLEARKCKSINLRDVNTILKYRKHGEILISSKENDEALDRIKVDLGEELTHEVLEGKCKLVTLVESPGGYNGYTTMIMDFIENLRSNGSETMSFSFQSTASASFMIVSTIEKRYSLFESEFMFHRGNMPELPDDESPGELSEDDEFEDKEEFYSIEEMGLNEDIHLELDMKVMEETYDRFFKDCDAESRGECLMLIEECLEKINADAYFSGEHLLRLGVLKDCLSPDDLVDMITNNIGLVPKEGTGLAKVLEGLRSIGRDAVKSGLFSSKNLLEEIESPVFRDSITGKIL